MTVEWRITRTNDSTTDGDLYDVHLTDAFNRFAREARAFFDDPDKDKPDVYEKYSPVELDYRIPDLGTGWTRRFGGYVAETSTEEESTEVALLSYDAGLRGRAINRGYTDQTISYILEDLITSEIVPVEWASGANVNIQNDATLTREYQGEPLDSILGELAIIAAGSAPNSQEWGANNDNEIYFRPRNTSTSPRNFKTGGYWDLEVNEGTKNPANRAKVYYGDVSADGSTDNRDAVVVEKRDEQNEAGAKLGTSGGLVEPISKYYPQISTEEAAKQKARDLLERHANIKTGNFETYEALGVRPGDVAWLQNDPRGIDKEIRIAQLTYRWQADTTAVRYAENTAGVLDTLVVLSDEVARLDARGQDSTATADQLQALEEELGARIGIKVTKRTFDTAETYTPPPGQAVDFTMDPEYSPPDAVKADLILNITSDQTDSEVIIDNPP
jgi:hypothetical protein